MRGAHCSRALDADARSVVESAGWLVARVRSLVRGCTLLGREAQGAGRAARAGMRGGHIGGAAYTCLNCVDGWRGDRCRIAGSCRRIRSPLGAIACSPRPHPCYRAGRCRGHGGASQTTRGAGRWPRDTIAWHRGRGEWTQQPVALARRHAHLATLHGRRHTSQSNAELPRRRAFGRTSPTLPLSCFYIVRRHESRNAHML